MKGAALILLDAYEKAAETNELVEWIETQLLAEVQDSTQLRFVIGGQKVPAITSSRWIDRAAVVELHRISDQRAWMEWIREKNPHVDEKHVESLVLGLEGMPLNISTALERLSQKLNPDS